MRQRNPRTAFSLLEVVITVFIAAIMVLAIVAGIVYALQAQKMARERSMAQRQAAAILEEARRLTFGQLVPFDDRPVLVDDNREPDNEDNNLMGLASLRIYRAEDRVELQQADGQDLVLVEAEVVWESRGRERSVVLVAHFAP